MAKGCLVICLVIVICGIGVLSKAAEPPALARLSGVEKERLAKLIAGAKKEGELIGYSGTWRPDVQAKMIPLFRQEYGLSDSDLKIKIISTRTGAIVTKISEELRAKVYKTDIVNTAPTSFYDDLIAKGEIMAYDSPEYKHFSPLVADPNLGPANPPYYISGKVTAYVITYNPQYIKEEIVHWKDVLKYKGKISCGDVSKSFSYTEAYLAIRKVIDKKFFQDLGKLKPFLLVSATDLLNKCVTGEYPIVLISSPNTVFRLNQKGAGLKIVFPPEGWPAVGWPVAILSRALHPNAAKLFIDFVHGESCQELFLNFAGDIMGRLGLKSKYPDYPKPIYELKGSINMDWRKVTQQERLDAREEFRRSVIEGK